MRLVAAAAPGRALCSYKQDIEDMVRETVHRWLGHEFVRLSNERAAKGTTAADEARAVLAEMDDRLHDYGLSLADTARSRLWARDPASRDAAGKLRRQVLAGPARSASSSYVCPQRLPQGARVALDLAAVRPPADASWEKFAVERDPPAVPIRYLVAGDLVVFSGMTAVLPTFDEQMDAILARASSELEAAGTSWEGVAHAGFYHHRSVTADTVDRVFRRRVGLEVPERAFVPVDGYSAPGKLVELELTAARATEARN
jgi:enamine deaminase RidA (YjgF/YER057c/UK114 family)